MKRSVLLLVHPHYDPRAGRSKAPTESDVYLGLRRLGYSVAVARVDDDLRQLDRELASHRPAVVFNLLEEFRGEAVYDFNLIAYLEALGVAYTGCNPRALAVTRNKRWTSHLLGAAGVNVPRENVLPAIVKFNREHASMGLRKASVVRDRAALVRARTRMRAVSAAEILVQEFVPGRELTVSVWGHRRAATFVPWVLQLPGPLEIATERVKFDRKYRQSRGIRTRALRDEALARLVQGQALSAFQTLDMSGYARFDFRVRADGAAYMIDVNANPCLAKDEDFAQAGRASGFSYPEILERIVKLAREYDPKR